MKKFTLIIATAFLLVGCATSNVNSAVSADEIVDDISESDKVVVCGEVDGETQTYPTLGDLHSDGAVFKYYGPCYE